MKKRNSFIFYVILIFTITSCKSQINNSVKSELNTSIIAVKDSVSCSEGDNTFKIVYSLPKVNSYTNEKKINELIYHQIKANSELFEYLDSNAILTTELALQSMFNKLRGDCSTLEYGFGEINSYYNTQYNHGDYISIEVFREKDFSNYQQNTFSININIKEVRVLKIDEIIKKEFKKELISKIENIISKEIDELLRNTNLSNDEKEIIRNKIKEDKIFPLKNYPRSWMLKGENKEKGINFKFSLGLWNASERHLDIHPELFFTFEELQGYITESFKKSL